MQTKNLESGHKIGLSTEAFITTAFLQGSVTSRFHGAPGLPRAQKVRSRKGIAENPREEKYTPETRTVIPPFLGCLFGLS